MKDDLNASEKRLIAALDRINTFIDRTAERRSIPADPATQDAEAAAQLAECRAQNQRLADELAALRASHSSAVAGFESRLGVMNERLAETEERAVQLAAANEALAEANRALLAAQPDDAEGVRLALDAEIESLRATRSAEMSKLGEIMDTLDRMLNLSGAEIRHAPEPEPARPAMVETPPPLEPGMAEMGAGEMADPTDKERG